MSAAPFNETIECGLNCIKKRTFRKYFPVDNERVLFIEIHLVLTEMESKNEEEIEIQLLDALGHIKEITDEYLQNASSVPSKLKLKHSKTERFSKGNLIEGDRIALAYFFRKRLDHSSCFIWNTERNKHKLVECPLFKEKMVVYVASLEGIHQNSSWKCILKHMEFPGIDQRRLDYFFQPTVVRSEYFEASSDQKIQNTETTTKSSSVNKAEKKDDSTKAKVNNEKKRTKKRTASEATISDLKSPPFNWSQLMSTSLSAAQLSFCDDEDDFEKPTTTTMATKKRKIEKKTSKTDEKPFRHKSRSRGHPTASFDAKKQAENEVNASVFTQNTIS